MKTCKSCSQMNPDNVKYCEHCGGSEFIVNEHDTHINLDKITPIKRLVICPRCGEENPSNTLICQHCGTNLDDSDSKPDDTVANNSDIASAQTVAEPIGSPPDEKQTNNESYQQDMPVDPTVDSHTSKISDIIGNYTKNTSSDTDAETSKLKIVLNFTLENWKILSISLACVVLAFIIGRGIGKLNTVPYEEYEKLWADHQTQTATVTQYETQIAEYEKIIQPYKDLSDAQIAEQTAAANLKAKQDEEALVAKKAAEEKAAAEKAAAEKAAAEKAAAEKAAAEKAAAEAAAAEAAKGYETGITYDQLARTPDSYIGKKVKFKGKVLQVIEGDTVTQIRLAVNSNYDKVLYCTIPKRLTSSMRMLEDDIVTVFGVSAGLLTYQSTMGGQITIPSITVDDWGPN